MTQNLRLGDSKIITRTLNSNDTDIQSGQFNLSSSMVVHDKQYGAYYNWSTTTAASGTSNPGSNATNSICPKGWKLPTYQDRNSLNSNYGANQLVESPVNFVYGGNSSGANSWFGQGTAYWYWTSTVYESNPGSCAYPIWHCSTSNTGYELYDSCDDCGNKIVYGSIRCVRN